MKKQLILLTILLFALSRISFGDIIIENTHFVQKCVKITNLADYPDVSLLGFDIPGYWESFSYEISSEECLTKDYKFGDFKIFAVRKAYLKGKDIRKIDPTGDPNAVPSNLQLEPYKGYVWDSIPISAIDQFYMILGFSKNEVILHKWKEVTRFNNGKPDSTSTYVYEGEASKLFQSIQTGNDSKEFKPSFDVYPNPANKTFHLEINNEFQGIVAVKIFALDGRMVRLDYLEKFDFNIDSDVTIENLRSGTYTVSLKFGKIVENKKIVIK